MSVADAIAAVGEAAKRLRLEKEAADKVSTARAKLMLDQSPERCFFKVVALQMNCYPTWDFPTAATDGKKIIYNPEFIDGLTLDETMGVICGHEVIHCCMAHHVRRCGRDMERWQIATDLADNEVCKEAGFALPKGAIYAGKDEYRDFPPGLSAEQYYDMLPEGGEGQEGGGEDPGGCGAVLDAAPDEAGLDEAQGQWERTVAQAAEIATKEKGTLPGAIANLVDGILNPKVPWQDVLRDFVSRVFDARDDYSWRVPNRRYLAQGMILPSLRSESLGHILIHVDVSGSTQTREIMEAFSGELNGVLEARPCQATIAYGDTCIQTEREWSPAEGPLELEYTGGGGTDHAHVWEYVLDMPEPPVCVICLTDGYTDFHEPPDVPVLWVLTPDSSADPPFGQTIRID
jgi:predicted metal-dependent peptidase